MDKLQWGKRKRIRFVKVVRDSSVLEGNSATGHGNGIWEADISVLEMKGVDHIPNESASERAWRELIHNRFKPENFLFEGEVLSTESGNCILAISPETAKKRFFGHDELLLVSPKESFVNDNNLKARDLIRFFKPVSASHKRLVDCIQYLFDKELTQIDVTSNQLHIPESEEIHFLPEKTGQETCNKVEINGKLRFADVENETWEMNLIFNETTSTLQLAGQWTLFVNKYHLKANDNIIFYEAKKPLDGNRYLIRFEKKGDYGGTNIDDTDAEGSGEGTVKIS